MYKVIKNTIVWILSVSYVASVYAAVVPTDPLAPTLNKNGISTVKGAGSGSGGSSASEGTLGSAPTTKDLGALSGQTLMVATTCNYWWLSGNHSWSWNGIPYVAINVSLNASSWTTYGTSTATCNTPLVVDRLKVDAYTVGGDFPLHAINTLYNVSSVSASASGSSLMAAPPCGGTSNHEAYKSGITWYSASRSGC